MGEIWARYGRDMGEISPTFLCGENPSGSEVSGLPTAWIEIGLGSGIGLGIGLGREIGLGFGMEVRLAHGLERVDGEGEGEG